MNVTLGQLVEFVLKNRRGKAFFNYTEPHIAYDIYHASQEGTMLYAVNDDGKLCGIVVASKVEEMRMMYVKDILTTEPWAIKRFVKMFKEGWPEYRLRAQRWRDAGKTKPTLIDYKTNKLCDKLLKQKD